MEKHHGETLERAIRKVGYSISNLSIALSINRRTVYNWFQSPRLKAEVFFQVGMVIRHNFSIDFPELFKDSDFDFTLRQETNGRQSADNTWKHRYIELLEKYNALLESSILSKTNALESQN